jgi:hypothetical protein
MTFANSRHVDRTVRSLIDRLTARIAELEQKLAALEEAASTAPRGRPINSDNITIYATERGNSRGVQ